MSLNDAPASRARTRPGRHADRRRTHPDDLVVHQQDVQAVVNALWAGGAEAMQIMDQRVISTSAVRCVGNTLILQGRVYSPPFLVTAIGDPDAMQRALDADANVKVYRQYVEVPAGLRDWTASHDLLPAYDGSLDLDHAKTGSDTAGRVTNASWAHGPPPARRSQGARPRRCEPWSTVGELMITAGVIILLYLRVRAVLDQRRGPPGPRVTCATRWLSDWRRRLHRRPWHAGAGGAGAIGGTDRQRRGLAIVRIPRLGPSYAVIVEGRQGRHLGSVRVTIPTPRAGAGRQLRRGRPPRHLRCALRQPRRARARAMRS